MENDEIIEEKPKFKKVILKEYFKDVDVLDEEGNITETKKVKYGEDVEYIPLQDTEEYTEMLRNKRQSLLKAFDTYKANVQYGIENETDNEHLTILEWYNNLLDLKEVAFSEIPEKVNYYL